MVRWPFRPFALAGRGLFTAAPGRVVVAPGPADTGWCWRFAGSRSWTAITPQGHVHLPRRSGLEAPDGRRCSTVEHLLAALLLLDLDDVRLIVTGPELPILDGSSFPFVRAAMAAGWRPRPAPSLRVTVRWAKDELTWVSGDLRPAGARTFLPLTELRPALRAGLFPGARHDLAILTDPAGRPARGPRPRMPREPLWHKLLDAIGDLAAYRALGRIVGEVTLLDPSHLHNGVAFQEAFSRGTLRVLPRQLR